MYGGESSIWLRTVKEKGVEKEGDGRKESDLGPNHDQDQEFVLRHAKDQLLPVECLSSLRGFL